jgi:ABC-type nitrate/sulfonate/bicarbonate transport system ATPase subunit
VTGVLANVKQQVNRQGRIECVGLGKVFIDQRSGAETAALADVNLTIEPGQFVTIVGPSGCGKTTLLNILAGFEKLSSGVVNIDGQPPRGPSPERGVVFQEYALFPWLTVVRNVAYPLIERGVRRREADKQARAWLERVGLLAFADRHPHQLSGGMKQRVALIRVLANEPRILLMDEPFAALDAFTRRSLQREVERLWSQTRSTAVFITHNVEEAILLGDRVIVMSSQPGRVKEMIDVDLDRPRDVTSGPFNEVRRWVSSCLGDGEA